MDIRHAVLEGARDAKRLHAKLHTRRGIEAGDASCVDVFGAIGEAGAKLLFRPLDGLLGAFLAKPVTPVPGIIISTQRSLNTQRFTGAHELGHMVMGHTPSYDEEVGGWSERNVDLQEVAADAFASEFLLPRWLLEYHCRANHWMSADLRDPRCVYQLSLRVGASYDAVCWVLRGHNILSPSDVRTLRKAKPKEIKTALLGDSVTLGDSWADVWVLSESDDRLALSGGPGDTLVLGLPERSASGYLWDVTPLASLGVSVLDDTRATTRDEGYGGAGQRVIRFRVESEGNYELNLSERRPWSYDDVGARFRVELRFRGKERGLLRVTRESRLPS